MRRTTIILLSIFSSLLLLSVIFIFFQSTLKPSDYDRILQESNLSGQIDSISMPSYKILKIIDKSDLQYNHIDGKLYIKTLKPGTQKEYLYLSKEFSNLVNKRMSGDTLIIQLNYTEKDLEAISKKGKFTSVVKPSFYLYADSTSKLFIRNEVNQLEMSLKGINTSEVVLYSCSEATIDSCKISKLSISGNYPRIMLKNSHINIFNLDLDNLNNWDVKNCQINEENLTGSSRHNIYLPKSECKKMNWKGKTKDAVLNVNLDSDKATISFNSENLN